MTNDVTISPFTFISYINNGDNIMRDPIYENGDAEKYYNPFICNKAFSNHLDTIMAANDMNMNHHLDKVMQYEYLLAKVRPRKRSNIWNKKSKSSDDIKDIANFYGINIKKAKEYVDILTNEEIRRILDKGGKDE